MKICLIFFYGQLPKELKNSKIIYEDKNKKTFANFMMYNNY